jgi:hypothetical protein
LALGLLANPIEMDHFKKIGIVLALSVVLGASTNFLRAADNPAQAAARVALMQRLDQPDGPKIQSLPATNQPAEAVTEQPAKPAAGVSEPVTVVAATSQTVPETTAPAAAPTPVAPTPAAPAPAVYPALVPVAASPVTAAPGTVRPATAAPVVSPVTLLLVLIGLLLIALVVMMILLVKLRSLKLLLLKNPKVMAHPTEVSQRRAARRDSIGA